MSPALASYPSLSLPPPVAADPRRYQSQYPECSSSKSAFRSVSSGSTEWSVPFRVGLPTPPSEMTGVTYNTTLSSSMYGGKQYGVPVQQYAKAPTQAPVNSVSTNTSTTAHQNYVPPPEKEAPAAASETKSQKKNTNDSIAPYLQIPSSINNSKGSLAEFAAQIACLFWFEKTSKLKAIEDGVITHYSLVPEAIPTIGFQKWVTTILSTTQVSQNVILLALLFIYRLKKANPGVRGKKGSEYRLMTIALMMGNKFLDDNTYTNKTWAEVSGISVQEIHIMEVEFLSNVRYNLFVSKEEWTRWHSKLGRFAEYFDKASRMPTENEFAPTTPVQVSPTLTPGSGRNGLPLSPASKLPSPPATSHLQTQQTWNPVPNGTSYRGRTPPRQLPEMELPPSSRKRSWDDAGEEHPSKRVAVSNNTYSAPVCTMAPASTAVPVLPPVVSTGTMPVPTIAVPAPRLPRPNNYQPPSTSMVPTAVPPPPTVSQLPLPNVRAMSSVYNPPTTWPQQQIPATTTTAAPVPTAAPLYNPAVSVSDAGRRQSPFPVTTSTSTISPSSSFTAHTSQNHLSPSFFLVNRHSPYRPVRAVNTLLIPPPSTSLHQPRNLSVDQMHYQPLGKSVSERRTGVLPYVHQEAWPQGPIAQPNFLPSQTYST